MAASERRTATDMDIEMEMAMAGMAGRGGQHPWHVAAVAANYESVVVAFRLLSFVCNIQMHLADNLLLC